MLPPVGIDIITLKQFDNFINYLIVQNIVPHLSLVGDVWQNVSNKIENSIAIEILEHSKKILKHEACSLAVAKEVLPSFFYGSDIAEKHDEVLNGVACRDW